MLVEKRPERFHLRIMKLLKPTGDMWTLVWTLCLLYRSCEATVTCKNENGAAVDWYILYKHPAGTTFTYVDASGTSRGNKPISDPNGVLGNTLHPMFQNTDQNFGFISYNDQKPQASAAELFQGDPIDPSVIEKVSAPEVGHSKGVVMVEKDGTGIWLLHSTPKFPLTRQQNHFWPPSGHQKGQTFICVTFDYIRFRNIGLHLQYIGANVFDRSIPNNFHQELVDAANGVMKTPDTDLVQLTSRGGKVFYSIAKPMDGRVRCGDLYVIISNKPTINSDLYVQTWGGQSGRSRSYCTGTHKVLNVNKITMETNTEWGASDDHSKWCVTTDQNRPWTCIADVNRALSQYKRRGGALCLNDATVHTTFTNFIDEYEGCSKTMMDMFQSAALQGLDLLKLLAQVFV